MWLFIECGGEPCTRYPEEDSDTSLYVRGLSFATTARHTLVVELQRTLSLACAAEFLFKSSPGPMKIRMLFTIGQDEYMTNRRTYLEVSAVLHFCEFGGIMHLTLDKLSIVTKDNSGISVFVTGMNVAWSPRNCTRITVTSMLMIYAGDSIIGTHVCEVIINNETPSFSTPLRILRFIHPANTITASILTKNERPIHCSVSFPKANIHKKERLNSDMRLKKLGYATISTAYPGIPVSSLVLILGNEKLKTYRMLNSIKMIKAVAPILLTPSSSRTLKCIVENQQKTIIKPRRTIIIEEPFVPYQVDIFKPLKIYFRDFLPTTINCSCKGYPKPIPTWKRIQRLSLRRVNGKTLYLSQDDLSGTYEYDCICLNKAGWKIRKHIFKIDKLEYESKLKLKSNLIFVLLLTTIFVVIMAHRFYIRSSSMKHQSALQHMKVLRNAM